MLSYQRTYKSKSVGHIPDWDEIPDIHLYFSRVVAGYHNC